MTKKRMMILGGLSALLVTATAWASGPDFTSSQKVTIAYSEDVGANNFTGSLIVGNTGSTQLALDANEIQARNNNTESSLSLQHEGGDLNLGMGGGQVTIGSTAADLNMNAQIMNVNDALYFFDGATQIMEIDDNGTHVYSNLFARGDFMLMAATGATGSTLCLHAPPSGKVGFCQSTRASKTDIGELGWGLREVMAMKPVSFAWKDGGRRDVGFIAEDAESVVPELVEYDNDGKVQGFNYRHYTAVLTRAVQEQQKSLEENHRAIATRDQEIAELRLEVTDQAAELRKLREDMSALTRAVASMGQPRP